jgi:hypothetical protein
MPGKDNKAYKGWRGTIKAALDHHPDKFSKEACGKKKNGKLCPYAVFTAMKEKGDTPHYKEQPHTTSGTPHKKKGFAEYVAQRDMELLEEGKKKKKKMSVSSLNVNFDLP